MKHSAKFKMYKTWHFWVSLLCVKTPKMAQNMVARKAHSNIATYLWQLKNIFFWVLKMEVLISDEKWNIYFLTLPGFLSQALLKQNGQ